MFELKGSKGIKKGSKTPLLYIQFWFFITI
jgi:hypothetical protein